MTNPNAVQTSVVKKSVASRHSVCDLMKSDQLVLLLRSRRWIDAVLFENVLDGLMADPVIQFVPVPRQCGDSPRSGSPGPAVTTCSTVAASVGGLPALWGFRHLLRVELPGHQLAMPAENRFGRDDGGDGFEALRGPVSCRWWPA